MKIYKYLNRSDSNLGSSVIIISDNINNATKLIKKELNDMEYSFVDGNITTINIKNNLIIDAFDGDCYY